MCKDFTVRKASITSNKYPVSTKVFIYYSKNHTTVWVGTDL